MLVCACVVETRRFYCHILHVIFIPEFADNDLLYTSFKIIGFYTIIIVTVFFFWNYVFDIFYSVYTKIIGVYIIIIATVFFFWNYVFIDIFYSVYTKLPNACFSWFDSCCFLFCKSICNNLSICFVILNYGVIDCVWMHRCMFLVWVDSVY